MSDPAQLAMRQPPAFFELLRKPLSMAALALFYFITARLLTQMAAPPNGAVLTVWLPSGIAVAALLRFGPWMAVGAYAGSVAFELSAGTPLVASLVVAVANAGCELLCYAIVTAGRRTLSLDGVPDVARFGIAATVAALASAFVGLTAYVLFGIVPADSYWSSWATWFGSVAVGILLLTPFLVNIARSAQPSITRAQSTEFLVVILVLCVGAFFWQGPHLSREIDEPVLLLIILGLLWTAFRFSTRAMTLAVFVLAVASVASTVLRLRQTHPEETFAPIFSLQLMLGGLAMIAYVLAAMVEHRRQSALALEAAQQEAVANARNAGMAEIATNVLHNIGNVLNSVNVSAGVVSCRVQASMSRGLTKAVGLIGEHEADLPAFLTTDPRGRLLPAYLAGLDRSLTEERQTIVQELAHLTRNIEHIKDIVATQQSYAGTSAVYEPACLSDLVEDALRLNGHLLAQGQVDVVRHFAPVPQAPLDRARLVQILVNLISNALHAMAVMKDRPRRLTLSVEAADGVATVRVADDGEGIPADNLTRIFSHGFTTRRGGHGFGLHSCALAARAMGGSLAAHSDGPGRGAVFTLEVPIQPAPASR